MKKLILIFLLSIFIVGCNKKEEVGTVGGNNIVVPVEKETEDVISDTVESETIETKYNYTYTKLEPTINAQDFLNNIREVLPKDSVIEAVQSGGYNQFIVTSSDLDTNYLVNILLLNTKEELDKLDNEVYVTKSDYMTTMDVVVGNVSLFMQVPNDMYEDIYNTLYEGYLKDFSGIVSTDNWNNLDIEYFKEV